MRIKYPKILIIISAQIFLFLLISCSGVSTGKMSESYLSPEYEDKSFENVSMDVCYPYPQYELIPGSDTTHFQTLVEFDKGFKNYFPDGIMLFSTITKVGWVYFEVNYEADIIEFPAFTMDTRRLIRQTTSSARSATCAARSRLSSRMTGIPVSR